MIHTLIFAALVSICLAFPQNDRFEQHNSPYSSRIVGGSPVNITDFPYIVQVYPGFLFCGGSILSTTWIITAGHCLVEQIASSVTVRAGAVDEYEGGVILYADEIYVHPQYNDPIASIDAGPDYDVGLIRLKEPLTFGLTIRSISLIEANLKVATGSLATVAGWGMESEDGDKTSDQLKAVSVPIISHEACQSLLHLTDEYFTERMLCAAYDEGGKDACSGDSGGPLVIDNILVGIVSWGRGCARQGEPGVYTNVTAVREYIKEITSL